MRAIGRLYGLHAYEVETIVVGSGAAGFNAADELCRLGFRDLAILTEGVECGTSRNTGSDKQTYYKLSLSGADPDSIHSLAEDLFNGKCVDGDIALVEASLSAPSFLKLASLGVPFPKNRYGEYVGYKTDHDSHRRATSAGPYTSKYMTEVLEKSVREHGIEIIEPMQVVKILTKENSVRGVIALNRRNAELSLFFCNSLVLATGGPAGIYELSVYPESQFGATGIAFEAGCKGKNLTEWQYGLASLHPRWNVSGSYMQVLPRFLSIDKDGNEYDFLSDYPCSRGEMLSKIFLKGYQWPFDVRKLEHGSSIVDVLCYLEIEKGRNVYLDFMHNPDGKAIDFGELSNEAREYLTNAGAICETPIERLLALNEPAYSFYLDKGVDLAREYLEIGLCAQHNNGGLSVDIWWQSNIEGIFPVGEVAGSHGVYRPGGSALNAGQCGSRRASEFISYRRSGNWEVDRTGLESQINDIKNLYSRAFEGSKEIESIYTRTRRRMSIVGSAIRNADAIQRALEETRNDYESFTDIKVQSKSDIWKYFELRNILITQIVYLSSMMDYIAVSGLSRGSALYSNSKGDTKPKNLDERFKFFLEDESSEPMIQECRLIEGFNVEFEYRKPIAIPNDDSFFENIWTRFRKDLCIY